MQMESVAFTMKVIYQIFLSNGEAMADPFLSQRLTAFFLTLS